ncbi:hypothetical protein HOLleu_19139 [Holothuria leucospilota]|uniref:Uncharacterized protein n=1 Tax=Holothuria leucospilota TaxID=206669 RepID=A0A9Q1H9Z2_HOLLE|nr:hypothetical protein HOLleu_19139 [Holothuria leucospilota]
MLWPAGLPPASHRHRWLSLDERLECRDIFCGHRPKRCLEMPSLLEDRPVILSRETDVTHGKKDHREHSCS